MKHLRLAHLIFFFFVYVNVIANETKRARLLRCALIIVIIWATYLAVIGD